MERRGGLISQNSHHATKKYSILSALPVTLSAVTRSDHGYERGGNKENG